MVERLTRQSALAGVYREGVFRADTASPGVELQERRPRAMLQLNGVDTTMLERLQQRFGFGDISARRASVSADATLLWTGPGQSLWVAERLDPSSSILELGALCESGDATLTDLSHGRVVLRIVGSAARALLAKGCPLDIETMAPGVCAATHLGPVTVVIHWRDDNKSCDLYVARSFAIALWEWLLDAAGEFGYRVMPVA